MKLRRKTEKPIKAPKQCIQQHNSFIEREKKINLRRGTDVRLKKSHRIMFLWIAHQEENGVLPKEKSRKQIYNLIVPLLTLVFISYLGQYADHALTATLWYVTAIHKFLCRKAVQLCGILTIHLKAFTAKYFLDVTSPYFQS